MYDAAEELNALVGELSAIVERELKPSKERSVLTHVESFDNTFPWWVESYLNFLDQSRDNKDDLTQLALSAVKEKLKPLYEHFAAKTRHYIEKTPDLVASIQSYYIDAFRVAKVLGMADGIQTLRKEVVAVVPDIIVPSYNRA